MKKNLIIAGFFLIVLVLGLLIYRDYGITADEFVQRNGVAIPPINYVLNGDKTYLTHWNRFYGPAYEILLVTGEKAMRLSSIRDVYYFRHLMTFLTFWVSAIFFYLLSKNYFKSWKLGLISTIMLVLTPRIFADAFYNTKDIVFMGGTIIATYTVFQFIDRKTFLTALISGVTLGILTDIRILAILFVGLTGLLMLYESSRNKFKDIDKIIKLLTFFTLYWAITTIIFHPYLWENPIANFIESFNRMQSYPWNNYMIFMGDKVFGTDVPRRYLPVWITISTPLTYLIFFILGNLLIAANYIFNYLKDFKNYKTIYILAWFYIIPIYVILQRSTIYSGWRQLYFIYPAFVLIATFAMYVIYTFLVKHLENNRLNKLSILALILIFIEPLVFMVQYHPFQNAYFSYPLAANPEWINNQYDVDYWGHSYKHGLEYIVNDLEVNGNVKIYTTNSGLGRNILLLSDKDQKRVINETDPNEADYIMTTLYRIDSRKKGLGIKNLKKDIRLVKSFDARGVHVIQIYKVE